MNHNSFNNVNDRLEEVEYMRQVLPANDIGTPIQSYMFLRYRTNFLFVKAKDIWGKVSARYVDRYTWENFS